MFFYSKKVAVSLNDLYSVNYIIIFIFLKVIVLFDIILDSFLNFCIFFYNKGYYFLSFYRIIKIILKFYGIKDNNLLLLIFKIIYFRNSPFI